MSEAQEILCKFCGVKLIYDKLIDRLRCARAPHCKHIEWDGPWASAATLIPFPKNRVVAIRRELKADDPFGGLWCLPVGWVNRKESPRLAAIRETEEDSNLRVCLMRLLYEGVPNPDYNRFTMIYLARALNPEELRAGDDAIEVGVFDRKTMPPLCFNSHAQTLDLWWSGKLGRMPAQPDHFLRELKLAA